jgi:hypothetical protein
MELRSRKSTMRTETVRTETIRERVAGKARAHALLTEIMNSLVIYGGKPIKGSHLENRGIEAQMNGFFEKVLEDARDQESTTWKDKESRRSVEQLLVNRQRMADAAGRILQCLAVADKAGKVADRDLDLLTEELNRHTQPIRFDPKQLAYGRKTPIFSLAPQLLEYMNLCLRYGTALGFVRARDAGP